MAYIGQRAAGTTAQSRTLDTMTGDGSTNTLTLSQTPDSVMNVAVYYDGVMQRPGVEYTLSGNTLTFTTAPESGVVVYAMTGGAEDIGSPMAGSVTLDTIVDNAITNNKIVSMSSSKLTGALPALNGSNLTGLPSTIDTKSANDPAIDTNPSAVGHLWANTTSGEMFVCTDNTAGANVWYNVGGGSGDVEPWSFPGTIAGYTAGGSNITAYQNVIDKYSFATDGNATDVGDLTRTVPSSAGQSSSTHGYACGGYPNSNVIDKFSFTIDGNATDVGNLTVGRSHGAGITSETHGYISGGLVTDTNAHDTIDKFPFATDSDATDVGDLTQQRRGASGTQSPEHGYTVAGNDGSSGYYNIIDRFSFASNNNATDVGDATVARAYAGNHSSTTHGYASGGPASNPATNVIDKFQFAASSNSTDVGDLTTTGGDRAGSSSTTSGYAAGRRVHPNFSGGIEKFSFVSDGNAANIGSLSFTRYNGSGTQI